MKNNNGKPALLIIMTLVTVVSAGIILNTRYFNPRVAEAEIKDGPERNANVTTGYDLSVPDIASDSDGDFVSVWSSNGQDGDGPGIYFQRHDHMGLALESGDVRVNETVDGSQTDPAVAMDANGNFVIVWRSMDDIHAKAYDSDGKAITRETVVSDSPLEDSLPEIAMDYDNDPRNGRFVVTWEKIDKETETHKAFARLGAVNFDDPSGVITFTGDEIGVTDHPDIITAHYPVVAMTTNGDFMVAWKGRDVTWSSSDQGWFQAFDNTGNKVGKHTRATSANILSMSESQGAITVDKKTRTSFGGDFILVASVITAEFPNGAIFARQIRCSGTTCNINPVALKVFTDNRGISELNPVADSDALGNFTIAWQGFRTATEYDIYAQSYSWNDGLPYGQIARVGSEFLVNTGTFGDQANPAITMNAGGQYDIVWSSTEGTKGIMYQSYASNLLKEGSEMLAHPSSPDNQYGTDVAVSPDGHHAAVWVNATAPRGIFFTLWDHDNNVIAENVRVDSDDPGNVDDKPSISFFRDTEGSMQGRFVIAWEGVAPSCLGSAEGLDVLYREVNSSGQVLGSCELRANDPVSGNQGNPDIAAGYYNNDSGDPEDYFTLSYIQEGEPSSVMTAFHAGTAFTHGVLETSCADSSCRETSAIMNPSDNRVVYAWDNGDAVFLRQGRGTIYIGENLRIAGPGTDTSDSPDLAFLPENGFIASYRGQSGSVSRVYLKRYLFNDDGNPTVTDQDFECCTMIGYEQNSQYFPRLAADPVNGNFLTVWSDETSQNRIFGRIFKYSNSGSGGISAFTQPFLINSTQTGISTLPAAAMNGNGKIVVSWEGSVNRPTLSDNNGIAIQRLKNVLFTTPIPELQPAAEQVVLGGGRTMVVPATVLFPTSSVSTTNASEIKASIRDETCGGIDVKYIEVTDLDGAPFTITATIGEDFMLTPPGNVSYIPKSNASIRNWDGNTADTNEDCTEKTPQNCVYTINSSSENTSFELSTESEDFMSMDEQRALINKFSDTEIGKWRFYPEFKLLIPARTPPGNHSTEIIFTLT
jgi:hypothetical protein